MHTHNTEEAKAPRAARVGLTNMELAEKRRRIAEIVYLVAKAKAEIAGHEAALPTKDNPTTLSPRDEAAAKFTIAEIAFEIAKLRNESALLKIEIAEDKERFPR